MGRTTRSSKNDEFFCTKSKKSKNKPSEVNTESNILTSRTISEFHPIYLEALNVASSAPVFNDNEAVDDHNDNSLEFDDEGGVIC